MEQEVVVGTYDSRIIGYSMQDQALRKKYSEKGHVGCVRCIASSGRYLATGGTDESIKLYDMTKHSDVGTLLQHEGSVSCLCFYKSVQLLSASEDGTVCVWKCGGTWDLLHTLTGHKYPVIGLAVHPTGRLALSVGKDRTVRTWNLSTGLTAFTLRLPKAAEMVAWSPVGDQYVLVVGTTVMVYSAESGECSVMIDVGEKINSLIFVQDKVLAVASDKQAVQLHSISSGQLVAGLEGHTARVKALALSPGGQLLFSASSDGTIRAWRLAESLKKSTCVCSVETGARLTCIAALDIGSSKPSLRHPDTKESAGGTQRTGVGTDDEPEVDIRKESSRGTKKSRKRTLEATHAECNVKSKKKKKVGKEGNC